MPTATTASPSTEALLETSYALLITHEVELDTDGLLAWGEIFESTLGAFLQSNAPPGIWAAPKFHDYILGVVGRIAATAKRTALQSPRVTRSELMAASAEVMQAADEKNECRAVLEEWNKGSTGGLKAKGFLCSMFLTNLAESAAGGTSTQ